MPEYCPRGHGPNSPFNAPMNGEMEWRKNGTCSYCGSLNPDTLMARLEAGTVKLTPTDKDYKVYVANNGGEHIESPGKFYFQHLSVPQRQRFIELYNEKKIIMEGGGFYVAPFFCRIG